MNRKTIKSIFFILLFALVVISAANGGDVHVPSVAGQSSADLYIKDTPLDTGTEPNPDTGPMWVSEDIWVRTVPDPNYQPHPFPEASPSWTPLPHEKPEYRDPKFSLPNYVYVRVRNRGSAASTGTEELHLYWAKASTGLSWDTQWVDYLANNCGPTDLYGAEITKPRMNAATATAAERAAYVQAILDVGSPAFVFPDSISYWHKQDQVHASGQHGSPAFLPWHREMINRYEALLQEADPTVKLLYWDWTTDPENSTGGFNFFTNTFMGNSGRGTGGVAIGAPFSALAPPSVTRNLNTSTTPPAVSDATLLASGPYQNFRPANENSPNHNSSHGYIGGGGSMSFLNTAAEDPFFFLLHTNVDRLWAQWQRDPSTLSRLDPATAYDGNTSNANITTNMGPWNGSGAISPWTVADGYIVSKSARHPSVVSPPIYDTAPLVVPVLQPGEAVVLQIPWYPPNPADFSCFGGDQGHFCLLGRVETSDSAPFGMTFPEGTSVGSNTKNNNNIGWKNVTVVDDFPGALRLGSILVRNVFDVPVRTGLRFENTQEFGASFFDFGSIFVDLKPELFDRWQEGGGVGRGIEVVGDGVIQILSPTAFIQDIPLEPEEVFSVDVRFELFNDYQLPQGVLPKWDLIQTGTPEDPNEIVGGQRFEVNFEKLVLVESGGIWRYLDDGSSPEPSWISPDFDDSKWKQGQAELGFGDDPMTTIDGGSLEGRHITTYFRHTFDVADPSFYRTLLLRLKRDDGAVVYLNEQEIHRVNLPEDEVTPETRALRAVNGLEEEMFFPIPVTEHLELLREGQNVIAVEIHQDSLDSPDLSFDLELSANPVTTRFPPDVAFASPVNSTLFQADQVITIEVEALDSDSDGEVVSVSLFAGEELLGTSDQSPYIFEWQGAQLGTHRLRAVATDDEQNQTAVDLPITVLDNVPPIVELTGPDNDNVFEFGETIQLTAQASDPGGAVKQVEFRVRDMEQFFMTVDEVVGSVEAPPYTLDITDLEPGHYMLSAVAIDDLGASSQSIPVHFKVNEKSNYNTRLFIPLVNK